MVVHTDSKTGRFLERPHVVQSINGYGEYLSASSDGKKLALVLNRANVDVFVADLRLPGQTLEHITELPHTVQQSYPHAWTPDGTALLMEGVTNDTWSIFQQHLDGSAPQLFAKHSKSVAMAQVTPDGRWIMFLQFSEVPERATGIFRVPASGGVAESVPFTGALGEFHCSIGTRGRCVLREPIGTTSLAYYELDPMKGMGRQLAQIPWRPNILGDWDVSPDGTTAVAADHDKTAPGLQLIHLNSTPTRTSEIPVSGHGTLYGATWSADGTSFFVEARTAEGFELLNVDLAGHAKTLRKSAVSIFGIPSRNGKKLAFPGLGSSRNVWTMDAHNREPRIAISSVIADPRETFDLLRRICVQSLPHQPAM
jgi:hypothetical protein